MRVPPGVSDRFGARPRLVLSVLLVFLLGWDLWAIARDRRLRGTDTMIEAPVEVLQLCHGLDCPRAVLEAIHDSGAAKGPLPKLLVMLFVLLLGPTPFAVRLLGVCAHGVLVLQSYDLGRRLLPSAGAGLWAALVCGTFPLVYGLCRLGYYDSLAAVAVAGTLQVMLRASLERPGPAVLLGVTLAAGFLTKLTYGVYIVGPCIWFAARHLRSLRALAHAMLALTAMAAILVPYGAIFAPAILGAVVGAREVGELTPLAGRVAEYLRLPGVPILVIAATASAVALWIRPGGAGGGADGRPSAPGSVDRWRLVLFCCWVPMLVGLLAFNQWSRFLLPALVPMAVVCGVALSRIGSHASGAAAAIASSIAAVLLGLFVLLNLRGAGDRNDREFLAGMLSPDARPYGAFDRAFAACPPPTLVVHDSLSVERLTAQLPRLWRLRHRQAREITLEEAGRRLDDGRAVCVVLIRQFPRRPLVPTALPSGRDIDSLAAYPPKAAHWLVRREQRPIAGPFRDPDGITFSARMVPAAARPEARRGTADAAHQPGLH
jgi:hypothetical protein